MKMPQARSDALLGNMVPLHPGWLGCIMMQCLCLKSLLPQAAGSLEYGHTNDHQVEELLPALALLQLCLHVYLLPQLARLFHCCWS